MMSEPPRLIVVVDEAETRDKVCEYMAGHGFAAVPAADALQLDRLLGEQPADLVILDTGLPGEGGLSVAQRLYATARTPIILLAAACDAADRVAGLEVGADDCVAKPFDLRELLARVRSVLRRTGTARPETGGSAQTVPLGAVQLDAAGRRLIRHDGQAVKLTVMEVDLLDAFARHPNRVLSRDRLLDLAHNREEEPFDRSIDIRIARLRRKIEIDPSRPQVIRTVRGCGYMFVLTLPRQSEQRATFIMRPLCAPSSTRPSIPSLPPIASTNSGKTDKTRREFTASS